MMHSRSSRPLELFSWGALAKPLVGPLTTALAMTMAIACGPGTKAEPDAAAVFDAGALSDELSMPTEPTLQLGDFSGAAACGACHTQHYQEWQTSMHSYAMIDPIYRALVKIRQDDFNGAQDRFCLQCHTPIGTRAGDVAPGFRFEDLKPLSLEGVNCETCHKVSEVVRPFNAGMTYDALGDVKGSIQSPVQNPAHQSAYSELFENSLLCSSCHDVIEVSGLNLERPYQEWLESPAFQDDINCQSCHMPVYIGKASDDAPERELHQHFFLGVDVPLEPDYLPDQETEDLMRARVAALLDGSATISLQASEPVAGGQIDLFVTLKNNITAHNIPTGSTFNRQVWLEVTATDDNGVLLYETGTLDDNGDLRNYWSDLDPFGDNDLLEFGSRFTDITGTPELFPWRASEHHSNSISPLYDRTNTLFIPTELDTAFPVHVEARLRFRSFAPHLLRKLDLSALIDRLAIFEIDAQTLDIGVGPL